jgi:hypothetical protein
MVISYSLFLQSMTRYSFALADVDPGDEAINKLFTVAFNNMKAIQNFMQSQLQKLHQILLELFACPLNVSLVIRDTPSSLDFETHCVQPSDYEMLLEDSVACIKFNLYHH